MATAPTEDAPNVQDDDVLELGEAPPNTDVNDEADAAPEGEDEFVIELDGDEGEAEPDSGVIKSFREREREKDRRIKELEAQLKPKPIELGPKPTMESCEYDQDRLDQETDKWFETKAELDRQQGSQTANEQATKDEHARNLARYQQNAARLQAQTRMDAAAFKASEDAFVAAVPVPVQGLMLKYMGEKNALAIHMLGARPAKLAEISAMSDPFEQFLAIRDLSEKIKVTTKRKAPPPPEERLQGSGSFGGSRDKERERIEKEADRTGNRTALIAYDAKKKGK